MPVSYWDREASYWKRIRVITPIAVGLIATAFLASGKLEYREVTRFVGWRGPIEILPEITIEPDVAPAPPTVASPDVEQVVALDAEPALAVDPGPTDLESNPPRPMSQPSPQAARIEPAASPVRHPVSHSDSYVILHQVKPTYPPRELANGVEGNVTVELVVDERGEVAQAIVLSAVGPVSFQESTLSAVREFRFQPVIENGMPTSMRVRFVVKFRIAG